MNWMQPRLSRLLETSDSGVWGDEDLDNGVSVLRSTNISNDGTIDFENLTFRKIPTKKRTAKLLRVGDIILENSGGGPKQPVGRVCYFAGHDHDHVVGNFCRRLRPDIKTVDSRFLFWRLFYGHAIGETLRYQTQTTGLRNLQFKAYADQLINLPPPSEQRRIVALLDECDRLRRLRREADVKASRILPALFLKTFGDPTSNPMGWSVKEFEDTFHDTTAGNSKLQSKNFQIAGELIVIDQGQPQIAGYTDDESLAYRGELPVVVFGDHTRIFKYVDHPFVLGADGVRVLTAKAQFNPLFAYWHCRLLNIPSAGYSRHFKYLREKSFICPEKNLQDRFGYLAETVTGHVSVLRQAAVDVEELFSVMLGNAFSGQLTAKWRLAHMQELLVEMQQQARTLDLPMTQEHLQ